MENYEGKIFFKTQLFYVIHNLVKASWIDSKTILNAWPVSRGKGNVTLFYGQIRIIKKIKQLTHKYMNTYIKYT